MTQRIGRLIATIVAVSFLAVAAWGFLRILGTRTMLNSYAHVPGVITEVDQTSENGSLRFTPTFEFETEDGEVWRFPSIITTGERPDRGSTIEVIYDPDDPSDARENTFRRLWREPLTMLVVGVVGFAGVMVFVAGRAGRRRHHTASKEAAESDHDLERDAIVADFSHVQPRGPDDDGKFQYRIVAVVRNDGLKDTFYSDWLEDNPTVEIMNAGNKLLVLPDEEGSGRVIPPVG